MSPIVRVLILIVAAVGFLFDTYELLMFPVIGSDAVSELLFKKGFSSLDQEQQKAVRDWGSQMLWMAALCGGAFGLIGGWLIDKLGRKTIMIASILAYSFSPLAAAFSTELWQLVLFRCTTFIGVCVEMVAAVTWLAELFSDKRTRELVIGWTLATASLGGILVTKVYQQIVKLAAEPGMLPQLPFPEGFLPENVAWRYTLLTGLVPGAIILLLLPFVPESAVWRERKRAGTLGRPSVFQLFAPGLLRTTLITTLLSACGYAAAFGALQLTPLQIVPGLPELVAKKAEIDQAEKEAKTPDEKKAVGAMKKDQAKAVQARRGDVQEWQEYGGLTGRILFAVLLLFIPSRWLIRLFLVPGLLLFPLTYYELVHGEYFLFVAGIFCCGLVTVAQFSFVSEFLPRVFPVHLRGTGGSFALNVGGRMIGTMAAILNTHVVSKLFVGLSVPMQVATAAAVIGGSVYALALLASLALPKPDDEAH